MSEPAREKTRGVTAAGPLLWIVVFAVTLLAFYGLDHAIMGMQGLPLNLDLTPAQ